MSLNCQVLFNAPQRQIASEIRHRIGQSDGVSIVSGFVTVDGVESIAAPIRQSPGKVQTLVVGAGTYRAFDAFDGLVSSGVPLDRLFVHLGHTRETQSSRARFAFYRYHPMLHSKIFLMEKADGSACAFIGSHNLTNFALNGLNGEASVLVEGRIDHPEMVKVREHIAASRAQSVAYDPNMKEALAWWSRQYFEGLATKAEDEEREDKSNKTVVIIAVKNGGKTPSADDTIYFELPSAIGRVDRMNADVHIYIFSSLPASPEAALNDLGSARRSLRCHVVGAENDQGGVVLRADWHIGAAANPLLKKVATDFEPEPGPDVQQVRVKVIGSVGPGFEYMFSDERRTWRPVLNEEVSIKVENETAEMLSSLRLIQPEDRPFFKVVGLKEVGFDEGKKKARFLVSPESGNYILLSNRRRSLIRKERKSNR